MTLRMFNIMLGIVLFALMASHVPQLRAVMWILWIITMAFDLLHLEFNEEWKKKMLERMTDDD